MIRLYRRWRWRRFLRGLRKSDPARYQKLTRKAEFVDKAIDDLDPRTADLITILGGQSGFSKAKVEWIEDD